MSDSPEARAGAPPHEQGLSQEGHEQAVALIMSFCALDQVGRLYEINNKLVQRVLNDMLNTVAQLSDGQNSVSLTLSGYSFFLNHQLIRMDFTKYQKAQQLKAQQLKAQQQFKAQQRRLPPEQRRFSPRWRFSPWWRPAARTPARPPRPRRPATQA